jgi:carboxyvinyl-carboxyphosphonate phosphorylmutase
MKNRKWLKEILYQKKTILVPGAYDAVGAKILKQAGFEVLYMSGSAVTASLTGMPDVGILTMTEMVNHARRIVLATDLPLICDADDGYGNPMNVIRTVKEYEKAGVSGIHIEDQVAPKRCGHFEGKEIIHSEEMVKKIQAAIFAREDENFLLIARTDARAVAGLEEAIIRARLYAEAGADMIFIESPMSKKELKKIANSLSDIPLLVNMVEGGKTPILPFKELQDMGFKIVLYPTSSIRAVAKTIQDLANHLYQHKDTIGIQEKLITFEGRNQITGLAEIEALEIRFIGPK